MKGGRRKEIDSDLNSYMASRKRRSWFGPKIKSVFKPKPRKQAPVVQPRREAQIKQVYVRPSIPTRVVQEQQFEDMSPGVWNRMAGFFSKVFGKEGNDFDDADFAPDVEFMPPEEVVRNDPQLAQNISRRESQPRPQQAGQPKASQLFIRPVQEQQKPKSQYREETMVQQKPRVQVYDEPMVQQKPKVMTYNDQPAYSNPPKKKWSLFSWRKKDEDYVQMPQEQEPRSDMIISNFERELEDTKEDMREVTKIFLKTLERLPPEELGKFKRTEEFDRLKVLLKKHSVIK